jgi:hypothetical protein
MKKWALILAISCLILMMIVFPGQYDSHTRAVTFRHYRDAPSDTTLKEFKDAKASDRRHILIYEVVIGGVLAMLWFALIRADKSVHEDVV